LITKLWKVVWTASRSKIAYPGGASEIIVNE